MRFLRFPGTVRQDKCAFYGLCLAFFSLVFLAACSPQPLPQEPTSIPTLVPATLPAEGEMVPQPEAGGEHPGTGIFQANCAACHNLSAEPKVGPGLAGLFDMDQLPDGQPLNDENLKTWIRNGGGAMPGIPLSDSDLDTLLDFLKQKLEGEAVSEPGAPEPSESTSESSVSEMSESTAETAVAGLGQEVYEANCTVCHNLNDQQKVGPGLAGLFQMDQLPNGKPFNDENLKEWVLNGGGAMPGIPLADDELDAMIVYLKGVTQ